MFQFVAFYNKDLEILPGPTMNLSGPVHTNGDLYLGSGNQLNIAGQVTTAGELYRGRKNNGSCNNKVVTVLDPDDPLELVPDCPSRTQVYEGDIIDWNGMIELDVEEVTVPEPENLDPIGGAAYWEKADLRLVLNLDGSNNPDTGQSDTGAEIRDTDDSVDTTKTNAMDACSGSIDGQAVGTSDTFYNNREGTSMRLLEVDMEALLNCIDSSQLFGATKALDDDSEGGIVFHFTVKGPDSAAAANNYGVRIRNAAELQSTNGGAPLVQGMTVVSDQAVYPMGHYNAIDKIPAAILCDAFNPLSEAWESHAYPVAGEAAYATSSVNSRVAQNTTFNAAVLAGTDTTGGVEGSGGQSQGDYNGGLENYPRFHEKWSNKTFLYRGSFVSLNTPRHSDGAWIYGEPQYKAPNRDWDYDVDFNDAANLPPMSPRFVYLRQELFVREYEQ